MLDGTDLKSKLTVSVKKNRSGGDGIVNIGDVNVNGALGAFTAKQSDLVIGGFSSTGTTKSINFRDLLATEPHLATPLISLGGGAADRSAITARNVGDEFEIETSGIITFLRAASVGHGKISGIALGKLTASQGAMHANLAFTGAIGGISVKGGVDAQDWEAGSFGRIALGGALNADLTAAGSIAGINVKGGGISGNLTASAFGAISVAGGDLTGDIQSLGQNLGKKPALAKLTVAGGDLLGDVCLTGALGAVTVKTDKSGAGGNISGAKIAVSKIAAITVGKNLMQSHILAGTNLGPDHVLGGGDDTFASGSLGSVKVNGDVVGSVIAAGLSNPDGAFGTADDSILGGSASAVAGIIAKGSVDTTSYFAAGRFKGFVKFGSSKIDFATDSRFFVG